MPSVAEPLAAYVDDLGFTHVELMPVAEHPYGGSWGYQVTGYYAPTVALRPTRRASGLRRRLHQHGIGVMVDWVPAHFPTRRLGAGQLRRHPAVRARRPAPGPAPRLGHARVRLRSTRGANFLAVQRPVLVDEFHIDGLRVDAVASMLYLDYSREPGSGSPTPYGGNENLDAISFLQEINEVVPRHPGVLIDRRGVHGLAGVSRPVHQGGLGFTAQVEHGLDARHARYFASTPVHRRLPPRTN